MNLKRKQKVHFIGVGGIGMSALARWFLSQNYQATGSDMASSEITSQLKKEGVKIFIGHRTKNIDSSVSLIIHSSAINSNNPELVEAHKLNIPVRSYSQIVGEITKKYKTLSVAGAHGKSTTSSFLSLVLIKAGLDPTIIIGTKLRELKNSNFRKGRGRYFVLESDEHTRAFLNYSPFGAIITNIDREHLDCYKNLRDIKNAFVKFVSNIKITGTLVANKDNKNLYTIKNKVAEITQKNKLKVIWYSLKNSKEIVDKIKKVIKIPGEHNISNALGVYYLAKELGVKEDIILNSISKYNGAWRRMEFRGNFNGSLSPIPIYDDYAHHPTEIKATLKAIKEKYGKNKLICVFQPHQAKRLEILFKEFIKCFDAADFLVLLNIYKVAGRDLKIKDDLIKHLFKMIKKRFKAPRVIYLKDSKKIKPELALIGNKNPASVIIMMGAGDIYKFSDNLVK